MAGGRDWLADFLDQVVATRADSSHQGKTTARPRADVAPGGDDGPVSSERAISNEVLERAERCIRLLSGAWRP